MKSISNRVWRRAAVLSLLASSALSAQAMAAVVTDGGNTGTGTLRFAINNAVDGETISFDPGINPVLTSNLTIADDVTIRGNGISATTINGPADDRVFEISGSQTVTIEDLAIAGGHAPPGADGNVQDDPGNEGGGGGALTFSSGLVTIDSVRFSGNHAGDGGEGFPGVTTAMANGTPGSAGGQGGHGGAIEIDGTGVLNVANSVFEGNFAGNGGIGADGGDGNGLGFNGGSGGSGGFGGFGGAIGADSSGTITIANSTFTNDHAGNGRAGGAGGAATAGNPGQPGGGGIGGFGGAISAGQLLTVVNSTFFGNAGGSGGNSDGVAGFGGHGGAISATQSSLVANATIVSNHTRPGGDGSVAGPPGEGAGVFGQITLRSSILSSNTNAGSAQTESNCEGTIVFGSFNLSNPAGTGCAGATGDPVLAALDDNGGPTETMALQAGSPAIDVAPAGGADCSATDQRGVTRPQGSSCDLGAYELVAAAVPVPPAPAPTTTAKKKCKKKKKKKRHAAVAKKKKKCKKKKKKRK